MTQAMKDKVTVAAEVVTFAVMTGVWGFFRGNVESSLEIGVLVGWVVGMLKLIAQRIQAGNELQKDFIAKLAA